MSNVAPSLADISTLSYNGHTFSPARQVVSFEGAPAPDSAGRAVAHVMYTLTVRDWLTAATTTDADFLAIRRKLESPAGALVYTGGFGTFSINTDAGGQRDALWGPWPKVLRWNPVGGTKTCEFLWTVQVAIPECSAARYKNAVQEFCYTVGYAIDQFGYTTRTVIGHCVVPLTRAAAGDKSLGEAVGQLADDYREQIRPAVPPGFRRTKQDYTLSEDRRRLDFSVADEEMTEAVPPDGVVVASASHRHGTTQPGFVFWGGEIEATYELAAGRFRGDAVKHFAALVKHRTKELQQNDPSVGAVIPVSFSVNEPDIYGRPSVALSLGYTVTCNVAQLLTRGLFGGVPDKSWQAWETGLEKSAFGPRGNAGMKFDRNSDSIVDLCSAGPRSLKSAGGVAVLRTGLGTDLSFRTPDENHSWMTVENHLYVEDQSGTVTLRPLPVKEYRLVTTGSTVVGGPPNPKAKKGTTRVNVLRNFALTEYDTIPEIETQKRAGNVVVVRMAGRALRAGFPIPMPRLTELGGEDVVEANREGDGFWTGLVADVGVGIYWARWMLRYVIPVRPKSEISAIQTATLKATVRVGRVTLNAKLKR